MTGFCRAFYGPASNPSGAPQTTNEVMYQPVQNTPTQTLRQIPFPRILAGSMTRYRFPQRMAHRCLVQGPDQDEHFLGPGPGIFGNWGTKYRHSSGNLHSQKLTQVTTTPNPKSAHSVMPVMAFWHSPLLNRFFRRHRTVRIVKRSGTGQRQPPQPHTTFPRLGWAGQICTDKDSTGRICSSYHLPTCKVVRENKNQSPSIFVVSTDCNVKEVTLEVTLIASPHFELTGWHGPEQIDFCTERPE
jgi:hypothetical protein